MSFAFDTVMNSLIRYRKIVLGVLIGILIASAGAGYLYQKNQEREEASTKLLDESWQSINGVISFVKQQPDVISNPNDPIIDQIKETLNKAVEDLDILINDYPDTQAGVRGAITLLSVINAPYLHSFITNKELFDSMQNPSYLTVIESKNIKLWSVIFDITQAFTYESKGNSTDAIDYYKKALDKDSKKYVSDYILYALARLYENINNEGQAKIYYQQLANQYPESSWTSIAHAKLYILSQ